jgi:hypothetical protein
MQENRHLKRILGGLAVISMGLAGTAMADGRPGETSAAAPVILTGYLRLDPLALMQGRYTAAECDGTARYALSSSGFVAVTSRGGQDSGRSKDIAALVSCLDVFSDHSVLFVVAAPSGATESAVKARADIMQHFKTETRQAFRPTMAFPQ